MFYNKFMFIKLLTILSIILICLGNYCSAQTNQVRDLIGINTNSYKLSFDITTFFLIHNQDFGGGIQIYNSTTNTVSFGGTLAIISENKEINFYDASLNVKFGHEFDLGEHLFPIYLYIQSGTSFNFNSLNNIYSQTIAGFSIKKQINTNHYLYFGSGIGENSKWGIKSLFYIGTVTFKF